MGCVIIHEGVIDLRANNNRMNCLYISIPNVSVCMPLAESMGSNMTTASRWRVVAEGIDFQESDRLDDRSVDEERHVNEVWKEQEQ